MNVSDVLLDQWTQQVKELFPRMHQYQQETLAFVVQGIIQSGNAVMQRVAEVVYERTDSDVKMVSHERRMQRFVTNDRIKVDKQWDDFLAHVLLFWQKKRVLLVLDMTPYTEEMTIVYIGILVQSRILPLCWCEMPQQEEWDEGQWEILDRLFEQIAGHLSTSDCTLLADRGLSCLRLIEHCLKVKWHYVVRIKSGEWFRRAFRHYYRDWEQGSQIIKKEGDSWYGKALVWKEHSYEVWVSACWEEGYENAWFLLSDQKAGQRIVTCYKKRMKVEATFQDTKSRGCRIECSQFTNRDHLHRWLFAVFLSLWWAAHLGAICIHHGHREQVDRTDRREKGLLRIGRLWLGVILKKARRDLRPETLSRIKAQLANCLPFSHRNQRLYFSIYRQ